MAKRTEDTGEDTQAITGAYTGALDSFKADMGTVTAADMIMLFDGSKSELAQALAGTSDKKSTPYKTQYKNIDRWLKGERSPARSRATQNKFKDLMARRNPPSNINISVTGWIGYDGKYYYRTINTSIPGRGVSSARFMDAMRAGDTRAAYNAMFSAYGVSNGVLRVSDDNPSVSISFS